MSWFVLLRRTVPGWFYCRRTGNGQKVGRFPTGRSDEVQGMAECRCEELLEPKWQGVHDLLTRLLGRCTCEAGDAHVVELYRAANAVISEAS